MKEDLSKPKAGLLLLGCSRFRDLGKDLKCGSYEEHKNTFAKELIDSYKDILDISFDKVVYTPEDAAGAIDYFFGQKVDCIICVFLSWSEDKAWIRFLRDIYDIPLLYFLPSIKGPADSRNDETFIEFLSRGGAVGAHVGSGSIPRNNRTAEIVVDTIDGAKKRIASFSRASLARKKLKDSRFGLMASYNEVMWSTYVDPYNIFVKLGPELNFLSYSHLKDLTDTVTDSQAKEYEDHLKDTYTVDKDIDERLFIESARASMGLAKVIEEDELSALVLNDVDTELFETIGLRPGFYHPSINDMDAILSAEGDLGFGVLNYALKIMTGKPVNLMEPFYIDKETNTFYGGHAGPQDYTDVRHRDLVKISTDTRFAKTSYRYAGAPCAWYRIPPGEKTLAHLSEIGSEYKIVTYKAESLKGEHTLAGYHHSQFKPDREVAGLFKEVLKVGTTQHFAVVEGDVTEELEMFASINGFDFYKF